MKFVKSATSWKQIHEVRFASWKEDSKVCPPLSVENLPWSPPCICQGTKKVRLEVEKRMEKPLASPTWHKHFKFWPRQNVQTNAKSDLPLVRNVQSSSKSDFAQGKDVQTTSKSDFGQGRKCLSVNKVCLGIRSIKSDLARKKDVQTNGKSDLAQEVIVQTWVKSDFA